MKKLTTIIHLGMEGTGSTAAQAKKDAEARIEATLQGEWAPCVLTHGGLVAMVARQPMPHPNQWGYKVVNASENAFRLGFDVNYTDRAAAIRAAAFDLAQRVGNYAGLEPFLTEALRSELDQHFKWLAAYNAAAHEGQADTVCRQMADRALAVHSWQQEQAAARASTQAIL